MTSENGDKKTLSLIRWIVPFLLTLAIGAGVWYANDQVQNKSIATMEVRLAKTEETVIILREDLASIKSDTRQIREMLLDERRASRGVP